MSDLDPKDLTPGKLDGWAERAFTYGACAALAIAIHDAKGWALVKMTDSHNVSRRLPNGRYLDMEGQPEEVRAVVGGGGWRVGPALDGPTPRRAARGRRRIS